MRITPSQFFFHYVRSPKGLLNQTAISKREKTALLVASIALWIFTLGLIIPLSRRLRVYALPAILPKQGPPPPDPKIDLNSSVQPILIPKPIPLEIHPKNLNTLSPDELKIFGEMISLEDLAKIDLTLFKGDERREKFHALFGIAQKKGRLTPSEKGKKALAEIDLKTIFIHLDLLGPLNDYLPPLHKQNFEEFRQLFFSVAECSCINSNLQEGAACFLDEMLPKQIEGREAFSALCKDYEEDIIPTFTVDQLLNWMHLFSDVHWNFVEVDKRFELLEALEKGLFIEENTANFVAKILRNGKGKEILISYLKDHAVINIYDYLNSDLKAWVPEKKRPLSKDEIEKGIDHPDSLKWAKIADRDKGALLEKLAEKGKETFQSVFRERRPFFSRFFDQLPERLVPWIPEENLKIDHYWENNLISGVIEDLTFLAKKERDPKSRALFQKKIHILFREFPLIMKEKFERDYFFKIRPLFLILDEETKKFIPLSELKEDNLASIFSFLSEEEIGKISADQVTSGLFSEICLESQGPHEIAALRINLNTLFRKYPGEAKKAYLELKKKMQDPLLVLLDRDLQEKVS